MNLKNSSRPLARIAAFLLMTVFSACARERKPDAPLPGEAPRSKPGIVSGVFLETLDGKPSGREAFRIETDAQGGLAVHASLKPSGLVVIDSDERLWFGRDAQFLRAELSLKDAEKSSGRYEAREGKLVARSFRNEALVDEQVTERAPGSYLVRGTSHASWMGALRQIALNPGETRVFFGVEFGSGGTSLRFSSWTLSREPDIPFSMPDGSMVPAQVYSSKSKTFAGPVFSRVITDQEQVVLKASHKMPMGSVEVVLERNLDRQP